MRAQEFLAEDEPVRIKLGGAEAAAKARAWIEKVYAKYPQTMQNNHVMTWGSGDDLQFAMFELVPSFSKRGAVEVKWFQAYPLRAGVGSRAMQELQALAREDGISLTLFPWDKGQVSQSKLTKFYRGRGFAPTVKGGKAMQWSPELDEDTHSMFSKVMGHETSPEAAKQIQQQGFKKSHTGIFFNVGEQNYSGGGYGGTVIMAKVFGPVNEILNLEDDDLPEDLDEFADGEELADYARSKGYWAWTDGVQFAVLDPSHIQIKQGVTESLRVDVPNEEWLQDAIEYAKRKSPTHYGLPYMGKTTATVRQVEVPVNLLRRIPGMRREQQNVRYNDLAAIEKIMKDTGKLPIHSHSNEEYKPFINVAYDGSAWVNEGNHRIMAAYRLGWDSLPVEISYFDGGERVESGPMYPGKIGL